MRSIPGAVAQHSLGRRARGGEGLDRLATEGLKGDAVGSRIEDHLLVRAVNGLNTMCSVAASRVTTWSNVSSGGQPFIAQIGPPIETSTFRPRTVLQSLRPPAVAIASSRSCSLNG